MSDTPSFFLGRQPILDRDQTIVAYELLFRSGQAGGASVSDNRAATASVITHAFSGLGIDAVLGGCRGFINFDAGLLMSDVVEVLPPSRTVVELLETIEVDAPIVDRCRQLRRWGFQLALDDVVHMDPGRERVLHLMDVVKVDIPATPPEAIPPLLDRVRRPGIQLLAEKVDTREQAEWCMALGFDLFQGYYFARPVVLEGRRADPSKQFLMRLLEATLSDAENDVIERSFKQAPELTYKLMRLVNSVSMGLRGPIQSVSHALVILGRRQLQRWIQLLLFAHHGAGGVASPLLTLAATRGKLMELLAERESASDELRDAAFMTGILSLLDALLGAAMADVVAPLALPDHIREALLERRGRLGELLALVEALETGSESDVATRLAAGRTIPVAELPGLQVAAMTWANSIAATDNEP